MLRSLYTGISGMRSMQTMMDVTGNNIANVNTTGYKAANTIFEDTLSQTLGNAAAPQGAKGGQNPSQVGLGVRVAGITTNFTQGATQTTGRNSDMLIDGDGFFVLNNNGETQYTRNGAFGLDTNGTLTTQAGAKVQGWMADATGITNIASTPGNINIPSTAVIAANQTKNITMTGRLDRTVQANAAGTAITTDATQMSSVNVYDPRGVAMTLKMRITPDQGSAVTQPDGSYLVKQWKVEFFQSGDAVTQTSSTTSTPPGPAAMATVTVNDSGQVIPTTPASAGSPTNGSGGTATASGNIVSLGGFKGSDGNAFTTPINIDFNGIAVVAKSDTSLSDVHYSTQDGYAAGNLTSWKVGPDGAIVGTFDNGRSQELGKIAVATFANPSGLDKQGGSTYQATSNSGEPNIGAPGDGAHGSLVAGALEMSNVDLAQEFTNLIVSQRGFQANSRVITTSDSMLEELVNLKR